MVVLEKIPKQKKYGSFFLAKEADEETPIPIHRNVKVINVRPVNRDAVDFIENLDSYDDTENQDPGQLEELPQDLPEEYLPDEPTVEPTEPPAEEVPVDNQPVEEPVPEETPTEPVPEETPVEPAPEEVPVEPVPEETPVETEPVPEETPVEPVPEETPSEPVEGEAVPEEEPVVEEPPITPDTETPPEEIPVEPAPEEAPVEPVEGEVPNEENPMDATMTVTDNGEDVTDLGDDGAVDTDADGVPVEDAPEDDGPDTGAEGDEVNYADQAEDIPPTDGQEDQPMVDQNGMPIKRGPGLEYDATRKYNLLLKFISLTNALQNYITKLENKMSDDVDYNAALKDATKSFHNIYDICYDYIVMKYEASSYTNSFLFYQNMIVNVQMIFDMLLKIKTIYNKNKEKNAKK